MTPELAKAAMQFLMRARLEGQEVPAFNAVMAALHEFAEPPKGEEDEKGEEAEAVS